MNCFQFIRRWSLTTSLMALIAVTTSTTVVSQDADSLKGAPANWYRHVFQLQNIDGLNASVGVSAPTTCRVWLNGQKLESQTKTDSPVAFDVSRLLRKGANCLAIEDQSSAAALPAVLKRNNQPPAEIACRKKTSQPPVGWQKTDFNDKDWQAVKVQPPKIDWVTVEVQPFTARSTVSRFQNGQFRFRTNDHVALLGGTFIERAQQFGHLEAALMSSETEGLTFRNLGWSADTVFAESRGIFDSPARGYARMIEHLRAEEPDVVIIAYGQNEAMQGKSEADAVRFQQQFKKLIADVRTTSAEVVLVTPHPFLTPVAPLPDAQMWNPALKRSSEVIQKIAQQTSCHCVNLFDNFEQRLMQAAEVVGFWPSGLQADEHSELRDAVLHSLTDNGMHWNERGYRCVSILFAESLFGKPQPESETRPPSDYLRWDVSSLAAEQTSPRLKSVELKLQSPWLKPGLLVVHTGGNSESIVSCKATQNGTTVTVPQLPHGHSSDVARFQLTAQYDQLLQLLVKKNELYFHRWRPQNITYLFGFRKHEQGNNASDIAEFDPLIVELEQQIQALRNSDGPTVRLELK